MSLGRTPVAVSKYLPTCIPCGGDAQVSSTYSLPLHTHILHALVVVYVSVRDSGLRVRSDRV